MFHVQSVFWLHHQLNRWQNTIWLWLEIFLHKGKKYFSGPESLSWVSIFARINNNLWNFACARWRQVSIDSIDWSLILSYLQDSGKESFENSNSAILFPTFCRYEKNGSKRRFGMARNSSKRSAWNHENIGTFHIWIVCEFGNKSSSHVTCDEWNNYVVGTVGGKKFSSQSLISFNLSPFVTCSKSEIVETKFSNPHRRFFQWEISTWKFIIANLYRQGALICLTALCGFPCEAMHRHKLKCMILDHIKYFFN